MDLLESIEVRGRSGKRVELWRGDLTALSDTDAFDVLVVSAFPNDYGPTSGSLIGALERKGISVGALAADKDVDLRESFSSWLSKELTPQDPGLRFRRILCFEPLRRGRPPEVVGDIFRALTPILAEKPDLKSIALPLIAAGDQGYGAAEMVVPLVDAALHWLENGLPLDLVRIVAYREAEAQSAREAFSEQRQAYVDESKGSVSDVPPTEAQAFDYDVFISYSRANGPESEALERCLRDSRPDLKIFVDRREIDIGSAWQPEIFENIDRTRKVVAMLSPAYLDSKVCKEEFNIAWIRARDTDTELIFPIYLYTADLPTYMRYRNYFDCREGDASKIAAASDRLLGDLSKH
jgi:hypothetical protein